MWRISLFGFLPEKITPNYFTFLRLILIPLVLWFIAVGNFSLAFVVFLIAGLCDSIDGSLARTRNQITELGKLLDPLADKMLFGLSALFVLYYYPLPGLLLIVILFDMIALATAVTHSIISREKSISANWPAKIKMFTEVVALLIIMIYLILLVPWLFYLSAGLLLIALFFQLVSFIFYLATIIEQK